MRSSVIYSQIQKHYGQERFAVAAFCSVAAVLVLVILRYLGKFSALSAHVHRNVAPFDWSHLGLVVVGLPITIWTGVKAFQIVLFIRKLPPSTPQKSSLNLPEEAPPSPPTRSEPSPPIKKIKKARKVPLFNLQAQNSAFSQAASQYRERSATPPVSSNFSSSSAGSINSAAPMRKGAQDRHARCTCSGRCDNSCKD